MIIDIWENCYPSKWKGVITPDSFKHPAKFSSKLIQKIYRHITEEGWLREGDRVVDPFGGVALGALEAMRYGLDWTGCELEPHFVKFGNENIRLWNGTFSGKLPRWGTAILLQGDSRQLTRVVVDAQGVVSSPPYADGCAHTGGDDKDGKLQGGAYYGVGINGVVSSPPYTDRSAAPTDVQGYEAGLLNMNEGQTYQGVISSPPYVDSVNQSDQANDADARKDRKKKAGIDISKPVNMGGPNGVQNQPQVYGSTPGQLGALPAGDFSAAISSPPFLQTQGGCNVTSTEGPLSDPRLIERHSAGNQAANAYGESDGQLSNLQPGDYRAAISSPPFENTLSRDVVNADARRQWAREHGISNVEFVTPVDMERIGQRDQEYGSTPGQLGQDSGATFWTAAREIIEQVYAVLAPGAHAVWVCKGYVKGGKLVDFPGQWRTVCEAVGFVTLHEHHAMLVKHNGTSLTIDGEEVHHVKESKSFFRRLSEKKGAPPIDFETVYCMEKPR